MPLFFPRTVNLVGLFHTSYFPTMSVFTRCGKLSLSIVVSVDILLEDVCLIAHDSLLEFMSNAPSDSDGGLPLAIWHFREIS